eukprot:3528524-Pleurochrysis_carterae.AAC.3
MRRQQLEFLLALVKASHEHRVTVDVVCVKTAVAAVMRSEVLGASERGYELWRTSTSSLRPPTACES